LAEVDWDQKASATFHTKKKSKRPHFWYLVWEIEKATAPENMMGFEKKS
jgi:hypothetical protein